MTPVTKVNSYTQTDQDKIIENYTFSRELSEEKEITFEAGREWYF